MGFNCLKATEQLRGGSLLFTTKFPEISVTHLIDLGRMEGWFDLGAVVLNSAPLDWECSALTTRPLPHKWTRLLIAQGIAQRARLSFDYFFKLFPTRLRLVLFYYLKFGAWQTTAFLKLADRVIFPKGSEAAVQRCSVKKVFLKFRKIHRKTPVLESLFPRL